MLGLAQRCRARAVLLGLLVLIGLIAPGEVLADDFVTGVPRTKDGAGVRFGKGHEFHPGLALTFGYDSNVFWSAPEEARRQAGYAQPSLWMSIGNRPLRDGVLDSPTEPTNRRVDYAFDVMGGYRAYLSKEPTVRAGGKLNMGLRARLMFNPGRRFSVALEEDLRRIGEPRPFEQLREFNFNRIDHSGALRFIIRPGGRRFSMSAGYVTRALFFEANDLATGDRISNGATTELKWRLRDRSALVAEYQFLDTYYNCCTSPGTGRNEDSQAHRFAAGFVGAIGKRWSLEALAGWGWGLYKTDVNGPDFKGFLGRFGVGWFPTQRTAIHLRFSRTFSDSLLGNYVKDLGGELDVSQTFRWRMNISAGLGVYYRRTPGLPAPGVETDKITSYVSAPGLVREDTLLSAFAQVEQPLGKVFVLALRYDLRADFTDFGITYANGNFDAAGFTRNLVMLFGAVRF